MKDMITAPTENVRILCTIKFVHTVVWAFFAGCVVVLPFVAMLRQFRLACLLASAVGLECLVIALNRSRCPLTDFATRYTADRRPNFDIYLPEWLARWNKAIFGSWFVADLVLLACVWFRE